MAAAILLAVGAFAAFLICHMIIFHKWRVKRRFRALVVISLASVFLYSAAFYTFARSGLYGRVNSILPFALADFLNGLFVYLFIFYFYAHLVIVLDRSVTVRMMLDIEESPDRRLTKDEIRAGYDLEDKFKYEIIDMVYLNRLARDGDEVRNTSKGRLHAKAVGFARDYIKIGGHQ